MLYPILTESRLLSDLSGVWDFKLDNGNGFDEKWYEAPLKDADTMPVPASYNDLKEGADFRDHYGWVFYQRNISYGHVGETRAGIVKILLLLLMVAVANIWCTFIPLFIIINFIVGIIMLICRLAGISAKDTAEKAKIKEADAH